MSTIVKPLALWLTSFSKDTTSFSSLFVHGKFNSQCVHNGPDVTIGIYFIILDNIRVNKWRDRDHYCPVGGMANLLTFFPLAAIYIMREEMPVTLFTIFHSKIVQAVV